MNSTKNRKETPKQVEASRVETDINPTANDKTAIAEREKAQEVQGEPQPQDLSVGAQQDVQLESTKEELRRAADLEARRRVAERDAKEAEEKAANTKSTASEDQYAKRLAELEADSVNTHLSYNERFEARQKADVLRATIADLKGDGDPTGETVPTEDRPSPRSAF